jgi:hypothetical protein
MSTTVQNREQAPGADRRSACPACGAARYRCTADGDLVVFLDAIPRPGGPFLVNPYTCVIVSVQDRSRGRGYGFMEHRTVCAARPARA